MHFFFFLEDDQFPADMLLFLYVKSICSMQKPDQDIYEIYASNRKHNIINAASK